MDNTVLDNKWGTESEVEGNKVQRLSRVPKVEQKRKQRGIGVPKAKRKD
jgi:hypothetical protein